MKTHTKGPWEFRAPNIKPANSLGHLATLSDYDRATQVADGHLIAAAPELLEALKEALEFVKDNSEDWYMIGQRLIDKIQAVIAKAEGDK